MRFAISNHASSGRRPLLLVVGLFLSLSVTALTFSESVIVFGGEASYPPFEWLERGIPTGFNIDLESALAESGGLRASIVSETGRRRSGASSPALSTSLPCFIRRAANSISGSRSRSPL